MLFLMRCVVVVLLCACRIRSRAHAHAKKTNRVHADMRVRGPTILHGAAHAGAAPQFKLIVSGWKWSISWKIRFCSCSMGSVPTPVIVSHSASNVRSCNGVGFS